MRLGPSLSSGARGGTIYRALERRGTFGNCMEYCGFPTKAAVASLNSDLPHGFHHSERKYTFEKAGGRFGARDLVVKTVVDTVVETTVDLGWIS